VKTAPKKAIQMLSEVLTHEILCNPHSLVADFGHRHALPRAGFLCVPDPGYPMTVAILAAALIVAVAIVFGCGTLRQSSVDVTNALRDLVRSNERTLAVAERAAAALTRIGASSLFHSADVYKALADLKAAREQLAQSVASVPTTPNKD
jgi:hypothetical protein